MFHVKKHDKSGELIETVEFSEAEGALKYLWLATDVQEPKESFIEAAKISLEQTGHYHCDNCTVIDTQWMYAGLNETVEVDREQVQARVSSIVMGTMSKLLKLHEIGAITDTEFALITTAMDAAYMHANE